MEWLEADPLPSVCTDCKEEDCYNCENASQRWYLSRKDELKNRRKLLVRAIERLQKLVEEIDKEMAKDDRTGDL